MKDLMNAEQRLNVSMQQNPMSIDPYYKEYERINSEIIKRLDLISKLNSRSNKMRDKYPSIFKMIEAVLLTEDSITREYMDLGRLYTERDMIKVNVLERYSFLFKEKSIPKWTGVL